MSWGRGRPKGIKRGCIVQTVLGIGAFIRIGFSETAAGVMAASVNQSKMKTWLAAMDVPLMAPKGRFIVVAVTFQPANSGVHCLTDVMANWVIVRLRT